jgi:hypothetical protein
MFSDLSRKKDEFSLNSVVKSVEKLGGKGAVLADVSNILNISSSEADFIREISDTPRPWQGGAQ